MDAIVSAITSDLVARFVSFLMARWLNNRTPAPATGDERSGLLQRLLLRAQVIVEEADGRRITSHAMLRQLSKLREEMYRGCHALDTCSSRRRRRDAGDGDASRCSALSRSNPSKRVCLTIIRSGAGAGGDHRSGDQLQHVAERLETTIADVSEFVIFLSGCPRLSRQPYSVYMFMDKFMFGRQMEMERVVAFLLDEAESHGSSSGDEAGVLKILGPRRSGKSTLVEHACCDERVRDHFSQIVSFTLGDLRGEGTAVSLGSSGGGGVIKHRRHVLDEERVLVIVELDGERNSKGLDEAIISSLLRGFYSTYKSHIPCVTKIIVTSRSEKIANFGTTTQLVRLNPLSQEAYWYFFKARAFGSTDVADHPKLVSIAMDMADEMDGSFAAANIFGALMRSNFNIQFWSLALEVLREFKKRNLIKYDDLIRSTETDPLKMTKPAYTKEVAKQFVYLDDYQINSSTRGEVPVPKVSLKDILFSGARPQGKFDVLGWKSTIPPYYSYAYRCEIQRPQPMAVARKNRGVKIGDS